MKGIDTHLFGTYDAGMDTKDTSEKMFSLQLPTETYERLEAVAQADRRSKAFIVREALDLFFASQSTHDSGKSTRTISE